MTKKELFTKLWEAVKEPLREAVLAILPILTSYVSIKYGVESSTSITIGVVFYGILRGIDKFLHVVGKDKEESKLIKGLTRF